MFVDTFMILKTKFSEGSWRKLITQDVWLHVLTTQMSCTANASLDLFSRIVEQGNIFPFGQGLLKTSFPYFVLCI